jgi:glycosyltransferase involved in cell wall biosynthesis
VIAISKHVARTFDPNHLAARLEVIDNPFDLAKLDPGQIDREAARTRLALPRDAVVLGLVGQITPWKGQEEAVRALARVRCTHASALLLIVGETKFVASATRHDNRAYFRRLQEIVADLRLGDAVRFLGEREDVPQILRACDVALVPSWEEPFGRVVVEAMAMGVPVVATAIGGPAEIIRDGIDGVLVAPHQPSALASAITELLDDPVRRCAIGGEARTAALARFDHRRHAAAVSRIYDEVVSCRTAGDLS